MNRVYGVTIKKGGQSKSTTVTTIARLLALYGARVLIVDLAQPGSTSTALRDIWPTSAHGLTSELLDPFALLAAADRPHPDDVMAAIESLQLPIPLISKPSWGGGFISALPFDEFIGGVGRRLRSPFILDGILRSMDSAFDVMLLDFPLDDGILFDNAMIATDRVIVPFVASAASLEGIDATLRVLRRAREGYARATLGGILLTQVEPRNKRISDLVNTLMHSGEIEGEPLKDRLFPFAVRYSDFFDHAFRYGEPVWERTQDPRVWAGYVLLTEWILSDAHLTHLLPNRRHAALIEEDTRVMDTAAVAAGVGTGEARLKDLRTMMAKEEI